MRRTKCLFTVVWHVGNHALYDILVYIQVYIQEYILVQETIVDFLM
jgi:hypothetical protein